MAQEKYKWDVEGMNVNRDRMKKEKESLEENVTFLRNLSAEVDENWKSIAGGAYSSSVQIDIENFKKVISGLQQKIEELDQIANQIYQVCEDNISRNIVDMAAQIRPL